MRGVLADGWLVEICLQLMNDEFVSESLVKFSHETQFLRRKLWIHRNR